MTCPLLLIHVKIHRVVLPEIDGDTLEIGSHDIEVDRKLENCFCQELVADNPGVKVCARLFLRGRKNIDPSTLVKFSSRVA